jgi:hypothetical protein
MTVSRSRIGLLSACFALTLVAPAAAQQPDRPEGYTVLNDAQFAALPATTAEGERYNLLYVKFNKQFNELLKLHASSLVDRVVVRDAKLRAALLRDEDSNAKRIPPRGNLQLLGTFQRSGQSFVLVVTKVVSIESDLEHARRRLASFAARDTRSRTELVKYVQSRLSRYFQDAEADQLERRELVALMRQVEDEVRTIELEQLPPLPGGAETHIEFGRRYQALTVLAGVWGHAEVPAATRAQAEAALEELNAQRYLGRWYAYADFKDLVGFVEVNGQWLPRERADFLAACDAEKKRLIQHDTPQVLPASLLAQAKEVVRGMNKDMALSVLQSYPSRVDRVHDQLGSNSLVFEHWAMDGGSHIYFVNGLVFLRVDPQ